MHGSQKHSFSLPAAPHFSPVPQRAHFGGQASGGSICFPASTVVHPSLSSDGKAVRSAQEGRVETTKHRRKSGRGRPTVSALPRLLGGLVLSKWRQVSVTGASLAGYNVMSALWTRVCVFSLHQDSSHRELYLNLPILPKN